MSTAVEKLRKSAADLAAKLRAAEQSAAEEADAIRERNAQRRADHWHGIGDRIAATNNASTQAHKHVVDLVAAGQVSAALDAYPDYVRANAAHRNLIGAARRATATYVWTETAQVDPDAQPHKANGLYVIPETKQVERRVLVIDHDGGTPYGARTVYPAGVPESPADGAPSPWDELLAKGMDRVRQQGARDFMGEFMAPLTDALETEPDA